MPSQAFLRVPAFANRGLVALLPLVFVFYSFLLLSPEVEISIFGVSFPSYRLALLVMALPAFWMMVNNKQGSASTLDYVVAFTSFWIMLSFITVYGFESGIVRGTGIVIDTALMYMVARVCVRTPDELRYFLLLILPGLIFAGGSLVLESLSGRLFVRPFFISIFGGLDSFAGGEVTGSQSLEKEYRLGGLLRAFGPFPHPILAGAIMAGFLPLYYFSGLRSWPFILGVTLAFTSFFSLSSAAFLSLMIAVGAIGVYHVKSYIPKISWWTIVSLIGLAVWAIHMSTGGGIISALARLTLTPSTAYYRQLIWEYGSKTVANNPWFGIGYRQWDRPSWMIGDSVDAHFLLLAMRHGLIVPALLLAGIAYGMIKLGINQTRLTPRDKAFMIGVNITLFLYLIVGQTVNYFGSANLVLMTMVAFLASMVAWSDCEVKMRSQLRLMPNGPGLYRKSR